jgi:hypothetical protein
MRFNFNFTGSMLSEIKVDKNTGWIIEAKLNQEMKGESQFNENTQKADGMNIPLTMTILNNMIITN